MIILFEKFNEQDYIDFRSKQDRKVIQRYGDKNIFNFVKEGDLDGLNYLLDNGYNIAKAANLPFNIITIAVINNQIEILEYLIEKIGKSWNYDNPINSVSLPDIIGAHDYNKPNVVSKKMVEQLKIITKYGFNFWDDSHNLINLYLCENGFVGKDYARVLIKGTVTFIDWLLKNYPENYKLCRDILTDSLKRKYSYLEQSIKYNI